MMENSSMKLKNDHKNMSISVVDRYLRSINEKMRSDSHDLKDVRLSVNLLDRFVQGESLNVVVLTLYSPNEGYTLALKIHDALENETSLIPYHEDELLNCIDNQQLPPVLVELLEEVGAQVFYDGCVFVEVRDRRENSKLSWHVLLKPSSQSVMADAQQICQENGWGSEELLQLESVLCMAVAEPLCLSPNPALGDLAINRDRVAKQMQSTVLQRTRRNLIANGMKRKSESTIASEFRLYEFLRKKSRLGRTIPPILKVRDDTSNSSSPPPQLDVADVLRLAKPLERPKETTDCSTVTCEEYQYETDRVNGRVNLVRLTILQRPATEEFLGQLYVDRDFRDGTVVGTVNGAGASCMFSLGSRLNVNRYIQQFTEIFTEEGRKSVKITHQVQNQPPRVMYTQSMREKERLREKEAAALQLQQQQQQQANETAASIVETEASAPTVIPVVEPVAPVTAPLTKTALIESLKSGQVTPAIATLVSNLLTSAQQNQIRSQGATGVHVLTNGQQQSLLRPSAAGVGVRAATGSVQNIQLITQALPVHQGQAQLRPNIRPTALAALLTTKATAATPVTSAGKGKVIPGTGVQGQVIRPSTASPASVTTPILPSYSQAISQTTGGGTIVRAIRPSVGTTAAGTVVGTIRRPSDGMASSNGPTVGQRFSLTTLLAGTPSADSPNSNGSNSAASGSNNGGSAVSLPSLLERLQQQQSPGKLQPTGAAVSLNNNNNNAPTAKLMVNSVNSNHNNNLNVQSINLAGLQGAVASLPLQSIQVSIPGIATPFSLSVAVTSSSTQASTVSTPSVMGSVRLATAVNTTSGTPISIPLSVLQIPSSGGPVQLIGSVAKSGAAGTGAGGAAGSTAATVQRAQATNNSANNAQMASTAANPTSGSLQAQQQLQLALQRQAASVQIQLQQKMAAKQQQQQQQQQPKPKPQHNS